MALDDSDDQAPPQPGAPSPALAEFQNVFSHPEAKDWAGEVTTRLNDYFQRRQIADSANAAGQQFVQDIDQFKGGLVKMVQQDPHAVHTALDIVPPTLSALISNMPNQPANAEDHHAALVGHMQGEIATAAITSAAETHEGTARALLGNDRIQDVLGDAAGPLGIYIDMQAAARVRDQRADAGQAQAAHIELADQSARNYLDALVDPNTGNPRSPPGWNQAVLADNRVPPAMKVELFNAHEQLGANGDAITDPHAVMDLVGRMARGQATQRDLYPMIGNNLSMSDAGYLAQQLKTAGQPMSAMKQLSATMEAAARQIAPNGDIAETRALGRFINYLLPAVRNGGDLDPNSPNSILPTISNSPPDVAANFWNQFRAKGDDILGAPPVWTNNSPNSTADRPRLGDIFGRGAGKKLTPPGNIPRVAPGEEDRPSNPELRAEMKPLPMIPPTSNPLAPPRTNEKPIGGTESGDFFQRKIREGGGGTERS